MGRVLAVITARGGSKSVPRKNLRPLGGKPLIVHTIEAALGAGGVLYRVVVSTEDAEIARISREAGAEVPFMRPPELATDDAPSLPVVQHATRFVETRDGVHLDWVMTLQPTTPFRDAADIRNAVELAERGDCDCVVSVFDASHVHPHRMLRLDDGFLVPFVEGVREGQRRQDFAPVAYKRNGGIYLTRRDIIMDQGRLYGERVRPYLTPAERSIDIDTELDFCLAEALIRSQGHP